jgi:PadR family transcriptional regulator, regulatory protein PadR
MSDLSLSKKEGLILQLLHSSRPEQLCGLDLVGRSDGALKKGTVYVTLTRMGIKGLVILKREDRTPLPVITKRYYSLTERGQRLIEALLYS